MGALTLVLLVAGLVLLVVGAEFLVRGASRLALAVGISPLVVGLTVVSFGTSSPELAVGVQSALVGQADIALGNVVGSNIFNVLFVLGLCAVILPLSVSYQLIRLDVPIMIGVSVLMLLMALDGKIGRLEGMLLFAGLIVYMVFSIWQSRRENAQAVTSSVGDSDATARPRAVGQLLLNGVLLVGGLGLLLIGSRWLVEGAVAIAQALGVSPLIIGLTIIAIGTSLPEVAASVVAAIRGERDLAVGNVVGSCIFNILAILGLTSAVAPDGVNVPQAALSFDIPVMIAVALSCFPIFFTGFVVARWEGALLLGYYTIYTLYLILTATEHDALWLLNTTMTYVVPLTAALLIVLGIRARRTNHRNVTT